MNDPMIGLTPAQMKDVVMVQAKVIKSLESEILSLKAEAINEHEDENSPLLTVKEYCGRAKISVPHAYQLWERGEGAPRIKIGRRTFIRVLDFEDWIASLTDKTTGDG